MRPLASNIYSLSLNLLHLAMPKPQFMGAHYQVEFNEVDIDEMLPKLSIGIESGLMEIFKLYG